MVFYNFYSAFGILLSSCDLLDKNKAGKHCCSILTGTWCRQIKGCRSGSELKTEIRIQGTNKIPKNYGRGGDESRTTGTGSIS